MARLLRGRLLSEAARVLEELVGEARRLRAFDAVAGSYSALLRLESLEVVAPGVVRGVFSPSSGGGEKHYAVASRLRGVKCTCEAARLRAGEPWALKCKHGLALLAAAVAAGAMSPGEAREALSRALSLRAGGRRAEGDSSGA